MLLSSDVFKVFTSTTAEALKFGSTLPDVIANGVSKYFTLNINIRSKLTKLFFLKVKIKYKLLSFPGTATPF